MQGQRQSSRDKTSRFAASGEIISPLVGHKKNVQKSGGGSSKGKISFLRGWYGLLFVSSSNEEEDGLMREAKGKNFRLSKWQFETLCAHIVFCLFAPTNREDQT